MLDANLETHQWQSSHVPAEVQLHVRGGDQGCGSRKAEPLVLAPAGIHTYGSIHRTDLTELCASGLCAGQGLGLLSLDPISDSLAGFLWQHWPVEILCH